MENQKQVAIYVRVSTLDQAEEGYSIDEQIDKLKKYCEVKDWAVSKVFKDAGFTGSNTERPGMTQLIKEIKQSKFDIVLVYKLDRLSRSQKDTLYLIEDVFAKYNTDFISLNENFDTSTPFGKAMIGILSVFAQLEREQIKERMQMGKVGRAKSGKAMSWAIVPFGYTYENNEYIINELQASIVRRIFNDYKNGISITKLKDHLNEEGFVGKDIEWSYRTIRQTLDNPVFAGYNSYKGEVYKGNHEPIISKELYDFIQKELVIRQQQAYEKNNNPRPFQAKYMLSGLLKCGYCDSRFEVALGNIRKDGSRSKKYRCYSQTSKKHSGTNKRASEPCQSPQHHMEDLEQKVLNQIQLLKDNPGLIYELNKVENKTNEVELIDYNKLISSIDKKLEKLADLYTEDVIPLTKLRSSSKKLKQEKANIIKMQSENIAPTAELAAVDARNILADITCSVFQEDYSTQTSIVRSLIKKIVVIESKVTIMWRFVQ